MSEENKNLEENIKRHISVLVEDMDSKFKLLADGQKSIERKVDGLAEDLIIVKQNVELLTEDMDFVKGEVVETRKRFNEADDELAKKADKEVVNDHENRIIKLENKVLAEA